MKIGDKVKFLNEIGGGRVSGFQGKNIVLVEDEDGFAVPMQVCEVVVVEENDSYDTSRMIKNREEHPAEKKVEKAVSNEPIKKEVRSTAAPVERRGGDMLSAWLAFVPIDVKELTHTRFEAFLVNDSNYYLRYACYTAESGSWKLRYTGEVEPNTKEYLEEFGRENLNGMERFCIQLFAYKRDKPFLLKPAIDVQLRIDPVKFYKLHTFCENDFFEQPALLYTIVEYDRVTRPLVVNAKQIKEEMKHETRIY